MGVSSERRAITPGGEAGVTMIELIVTLALAGLLMAIAVWGMHSYLVVTREAGTARDVRSALRAAAEQSLSEGRTYCVYFTTTTWTLYRSDCTVSANKSDGPHQVQDPSITVSQAAFPAPATPVPNQTTACPTAGRCAYFYPRGTALAGSLTVSRPGKSYTISVEGLTGRVALA